MGKPTSGGGIGSLIFTSNITGPPPGTLIVGSELWIDLGTIATGVKNWIGNASYSSPDKSTTFELRTNIATKSTGTLANTQLLDSVVASVKSGTIVRDMYKRGSLHITTVVGTGVEHWWLRLISKNNTAGNYLYSINYTLE